MPFHATTSGIRLTLAALALSASPALVAQQNTPLRADVASEAEALPDPATMTKGPEIKGVLTARQGDRIQVQTADGSRTISIELWNGTGFDTVVRDDVPAEAA